MTDVSLVKGVGEKHLKALNSLGIFTAEDLCAYDGFSEYCPLTLAKLESLQREGQKLRFTRIKEECVPELCVDCEETSLAACENIWTWRQMRVEIVVLAFLTGNIKEKDVINSTIAAANDLMKLNLVEHTASSASGSFGNVRVYHDSGSGHSVVLKLVRTPDTMTQETIKTFNIAHKRLRILSLRAEKKEEVNRERPTQDNTEMLLFTTNVTRVSPYIVAPDDSFAVQVQERMMNVGSKYYELMTTRHDKARQDLTMARQLLLGYLQMFGSVDLQVRDIKPENVMFNVGEINRDRLFYWKHVDLDCVRTFDSETKGSCITIDFVDVFQAKEQMDEFGDVMNEVREDRMFASDVYALGISIFIMVNGEHPFEELIDNMSDIHKVTKMITYQEQFLERLNEIYHDDTAFPTRILAKLFQILTGPGRWEAGIVPLAKQLDSWLLNSREILESYR
jgi:serine/threonine protein kinase